MRECVGRAEVRIGDEGGVGWNSLHRAASAQCATMAWMTLDEVNDGIASDEVV